MPLAVALLALSGCVAANTGEVIAGGSGVEAPQEDGPEAALQAATAAFGEAPREAGAVRRCWSVIRPAAFSAPADHPQRVELLVTAARCGAWLATDDGQVALCDDLLALSNTLVEVAPQRVEGFYFRTVALGLVAREDPLKGMSAMGEMVSDGRRAVELDPAYEQAGPLRVLGALHLRAPGPPTGVGSVRRALHYLGKAVELAPEHPGNLLFMAEAHLANDDPTQARAALAAYEALDTAALDPASVARWQAQAAELRANLPAP